jgi:rhamnose transport system permease protein
VLLSTLLVLNLRNGMNLATINGNVQVGVIGLLLILSVLLPNLAAGWRERRRTTARPPPLLAQPEPSSPP